MPMNFRQFLQGRFGKVVAATAATGGAVGLIITMSGRVPRPINPGGGGGGGDDPPTCTAGLTASDAEEGSVQTKVNAANNGEVVCIPDQIVTWSTPVTIPSTKGVTIRCLGSSDINIDPATTGTNHAFILEVATGNALTRVMGCTIDDQLATEDPTFGAPFLVNGTCASCFRIDHNLIKRIGPSHAGVWVTGTSSPTVYNLGNGAEIGGLIDNNEFTCDDSVNTSCHPVAVVGSPPWDDGVNLADNLTAGWGAPFARSVALGSNSSVVIEDNNFNLNGFYNDGCTDTFGGAQITFRMNRADGCAPGNHGFDSAAYREPRWFEIYGNVLTLGTTSPNCGFTRGGIWYYFNNTCTHPSTPKNVAMTAYRAFPLYFYATHGHCFGNVTGGSTYDGNAGTGGNVPANATNVTFWDGSLYTGTANGTVTFTDTGTTTPKTIYTTSARDVAASNPLTLDANGAATYYLGTGDYRVVLKRSGGATIWTQDGVTGPNGTGNSGWPCLGQPGYHFDNDGGAGYTAYPTYHFWNSNGAGGQIVASSETSGAPNMANFIAENREFYQYNASFNGTVGVGRGTSLPGTCTVGVGYWKTNEGSWNTETTTQHAVHGSDHTEGEDGVFYKCTSTNTWTLSFTPNAYPHSLRVS